MRVQHKNIHSKKKSGIIIIYIYSTVLFKVKMEIGYGD